MSEPEPVQNIAELYARDPKKLTDDDIRSIIADQRKKRHQFNLDAAKKKAKPKTTGPKLTKKEQETKSIDLGGLTL